MCKIRLVFWLQKNKKNLHKWEKISGVFRARVNCVLMGREIEWPTERMAGWMLQTKGKARNMVERKEKRNGKFYANNISFS